MDPQRDLILLQKQLIIITPSLLSPMCGKFLFLSSRTCKWLIRWSLGRADWGPGWESLTSRSTPEAWSEYPHPLNLIFLTCRMAKSPGLSAVLGGLGAAWQGAGLWAFENLPTSPSTLSTWEADKRVLAWLAGSMEAASGPRPGPETNPLLWPSSPPLAPQTFLDSDGLCQMDLGDLWRPCS